MSQKSFWKILLLCGILAGCSTARPYVNQPPENLAVQAHVSSQGILTSTNVYLDILKQGSTRCDLTYLGTVDIKSNAAPQTIGVPVNQVVYGRIIQEDHGFLWQDRKNRVLEFRFRPEPQGRYSLTYTVQDSRAYGLKLKRIDGATPREIPTDPWDQCK